MSPTEPVQRPRAPLPRRAWEAVLPPRRWRVPVVLAAGILVGLGLAILRVSNATSYLSDDPRACVNCHIMAPEYATWERGSHGRVAHCNDCHVPHDSFARKYAFKARDGLRHAWMFTFHLEPQVIRIHEPGQRVVQQNCIRCHAGQLGENHLASAAPAIDPASPHGGFAGRCWDCHRQTPHGRVHSLSAAPHAQVPLLSPP